MTATSPNLSQSFPPTGKFCDKFTAVPAMRPNLSQLFPPTGNKCNEFEGVAGDE